MPYADIPFDTDIKRHRHSETVLAGQTSNPIKLPRGISPLTIGVAPVSGGTGKVQYSLSDFSAIDGDTAQWFDWDQGAVANDTTRVLDGEVTGLRLVSATQNCDWEVLGSDPSR